MARPRRISDEQILERMRHAVLEHGPNVSLDVVAQQLQVTTPALLKRFGSRKALLVAALRPPENPSWIGEVAKGPVNGPLEAQLRAVFERISDFLMEVVPCLHALRESGIPFEEYCPRHGGPEAGRLAIQQWLTRAKKKGLIAASEIETAAFAMFGALQSRAIFAHILNRTFTARAQRTYLDELARFFTRALCTAPPRDLH